MFGAKTLKLQRLKEASFLVPEFIAFSTDEMNLSADILAEKARNMLKSERFAVRSSALVEDADKSSMAGQFLTELAVSRDDLKTAIEEVRSDALTKLGSLDNFSMIIQEFIEPDWSGVTFTRNPNGDRETVIEYHRGRGDALVSGEIKPKRINFYRTQSNVTSELPDFSSAREQFINIEKLFGAPQDIEWCIKDGEWYWLQSRPITSLSDQKIEQINELEKVLPSGKFYFAKTEVCDVAPRPTPETFKLLKKLYATNGPVDRIYRQFGITYRDTKFLKIILGELFVDCELELQSLFPSHSYLFGNDYQVRPVRLKGFLTSLRNTRRYNRIAGNFDDLSQKLQDLIAKELLPTDQQSAEQEFFRDYELIFLINILAQKALTRLSVALPKNISLVEALTYFPAELPAVWSPPTDITGNTFELTDTSEFVSLVNHAPTASIATHRADTWIGPYGAELIAAQNYLRLREYGRWLALRHISRIRKMIKKGSKMGSGPDNGYLTLPAVLTDCLIQIDHQKPLGVSVGTATGKLVLEPEIGGILVVSSLTPDIANHASILAGVIADHGGLLSHLAIIARELGLPVVVNYPIADLPIGETATIDGTTGDVSWG